MIKEIYDQARLLFGEDTEEEYVEMAKEIAARDIAFDKALDRYEKLGVDPPDSLRWGGAYTTAGAAFGPPMTILCSTSVEPGGFLPTPPNRIKMDYEPEWMCKGCGSVMLRSHRKCEECGAPRHFLYRVGDDDE